MSFRIEYLRERGPPKSLGVGIAPRVAHRDRFSQPGLKEKHFPHTQRCNCAVYSLRIAHDGLRPKTSDGV